MAKQLNVNLAFTADTGKAKAQLQDLQNSLNQVMNAAGKNTTGLGFTKDITEAINEVARLQAMLDNSRASNGGLDLGKFNQNLKAANLSIGDYAKTLSTLGPTGDQAFAKLAKSIVNAEVPLRRVNTTLSQFKTTLMNTARWQISSSVLHGFMGAVQTAYGYAEDLNESLNNIRIVTGQNVEQMTEFAKKANEAAKALSTTTTEYTNAALIYYQQGDDDKTVLEKTGVTAKMANVTGTSAEVVSDQLTAIWNNFNKAGEESYERYADVLTALGAATASSTDEIAGGLEKFASIADMIGLSYDYAATALATITATTRQSEDVVGTALKTIFARIQGLSLGETLDDGTNLNKYSEALQKVGISIFEQNGELKNMDAILDEMGAKWSTISKDQQVALAQTVAGVRQYNQLVSLMDNWDYFGENLEIAQTAEGALNKQADIYAESWEAASKRVQAAAEDIYTQLLDDKFFIKLNNGFAELLDGISNTIDTLGGLPGVLSLATGLMFKLFGKDMATSIDNWVYNLQLKSQEGINSILKLRQAAIAELKSMYANTAETGPIIDTSAQIFERQATLADQLLLKEQELLAKGATLTEQDKQQAQYMIQINEQLGQQAIKAAQNLELAQKQSAELESQLQTQIRRHNNSGTGTKIEWAGDKGISQQLNNIKKLQIEYSSLSATFNQLKQNSKTLDSTTLLQELTKIKNAAEKAGMDINSFDTALEAIKNETNVTTMLDSMETEMYNLGDAAYNAMNDMKTALSTAGISGEFLDNVLDRLFNSWVEQGIITQEIAEKLKSVGEQAEEAGKKIGNMQAPPPTLGTKITAIANNLTNVAMMINTVRGLFDTWGNDDIEFGEKLLSSFTSLAMIIPMVTTSVKNLSTVLHVSTGVIGWVFAAISALTAAITYYNQRQEKIIELSKEEAQAAREKVKATQEEVDANNNLIKQTQDALKLYEENGDNKDSLVQLTQDLAEAYDLEFSAIKQLQGGYEDYDAVLENAIKKQRDELIDLKEEYEDTAHAAGIAMSDIANGNMKFSGYDAGFTREESQARSIIRQNVDEDFLSAPSSRVRQPVLGKNESISLMADIEDPAELLELYDQLVIAKEEIESQMSSSERANSGIYEDLTNWIESMSKEVEIYREAVEQVAIITGQLALSNPEVDITSYSDFVSWVDDLKTQLLDAGVSADNLDIAISQVVDNSLDPTIKDLYQTYQAVEEVKIGAAMTAEELAEIWDDEAYDKNVLASINWAVTTKDNFDEAYSAAKKYANAVKEVNEVSQDLEKYKSAVDLIEKGINDENIIELQNALDWGNTEKEIIDFSAFLALTTEQQQKYLNEKVKESYLNSVEGYHNIIDTAEKIISNGNQALLDMTDEKDAADELINKYDELKKAVIDYQETDFGEDYEAMRAQWEVLNQIIEDLQLTDEEGNLLTWADLIYLKPEELQQIIDKGTVEAQGVIDNWNLTSSNIAAAETNKQNAENAIVTDEYIYASTLTSLPELQDAYLSGNIHTEAYDAQLNALAAQASSLEQLREIRDAFIEGEAGLSDGEFGEALLKLAENYDNCTVEIEEFNQALLSGDSAQIFAAQSVLELSIKAGELAEKYDLDAEALENYSERLQENIEGQELSAEAALDMAVASKRLDRGVENVNKSFEDYKKILKDDNKLTSEYSETMDDLKSNLADIFNVADGDMFSDTFAQGLLDSKTFEKALNGDIEALNSLRASAAVDIGNNIISDLGEAANVTQTEFKNAAGEIVNASFTAQSAWDYVRGILSDGFTLEEINDEQFVESLNQMIQASGMTKDQIQSMLGSMGVSAKVVTSYKEMETEVPTYYERSVPDGVDTFTGIDMNGEEIKITRPRIKKMTIPGKPEKVTGYVPTYSLETSSGDTTSGGEIDYSSTFESASPPQISSGSTTDGVNSGSGSGGSSKPTADARQKKSDVVERYKEINDQLDDMTDAIEDASKAADRLYGSARLKQMEKVSQNLQKEISLLKQKKAEADKNLIEDKVALDVAAADVGLSFEYAGNNIINYTEQMTDLYNRREALLDTFGEEIDEEEQKKLDALDKKIEKFEKALGLYEETKELIEDIENEIDDAFYEWQDNNYEMLSYKLELKLEVNDAELKKLEYFLNKYSDNFYKMAESATLLNQQIPELKESLEIYKDHKAALDSAYAAGEISQADYIDGLKEVRDGYYESLEALNELDKKMLHYYEDTLSEATSELADHTDHLEHLTGVFDHYLNLMDILGKQKDFDALGDFLGGKAETIRDRLDVAKEYYDMLLNQKEDTEAKLNAAIAAGDDAAAEFYKEEWDAIVDEVDAAQEEVLSLTEEWAEAMKAVIENNMAEIADTLEKTLTGGTTFDTLMDGFDKLNTQQEEYLTKTNQIYETNKLMRTANKALDETDNKVAKQKLKNFIDETKSLQENTKLSEYELEIQKAKYDLLLAEIALEEAQNAKSTVRLSRDSEGNFGYVYTADQDAIDDAQQGVDDADNRLYNLSLEGQQEYTEKYLQAQQDMYNQLTELQQAWLNGEIASEEEYERRKEEILNHYLGENGVLTTYQNLYNIAVQTSTAATADYWGKEYGNMTQDTEAWKVAVNQYLEDIKVQTDAWKDVSTQANADVEGALNDSETATKNLKDESNRLADTITNKVIPAIDEELEKVAAQTAAYAAQREELLALIAEYEAYIEALNKQVAVQSVGFDKDTDYSALMNEYLQKEGASISDAAFQELLKQRQAKIDWLKSDEGGNKGADYWGTEGDETLKMYEALMRGDSSFKTESGKIIDQAWFTKDYMSDEDLIGKFESLEIPLGALEDLVSQIEATTGEIKESTNATGEKIDSLKDDNGSKLDDANSKADDTNIKLDDANAKVDDTNSKLDDSNTKADDTNSKLDDANSKLEGIDSAIVSESGSIQSAISSAASTVASSVGGAISSIRSEISSLRSTVTGMAVGSVAGPVGTAIGGIIGSIAGKFDTGGYTGDWGPEGKLAILHQKELVLNANDTSNLLSAVEMIREISNVINAQANMASLFNLMAASNVAATNETLEQSVTIHAEFPNATDHNEIEEAFNNLVNRASQYANRK